MNDNKAIRVRFAPSPTGPLHIGGVRTALYNYFFAKKLGGKMILRIEDTDQGRFVAGAEEYIMEGLGWSGIRFDEGIREGGDFGPYRQSERSKIYKKYIDKLLQNGHAYFAFDTPEELDALRKQFESEKKVFTYDASQRIHMRNSLTLSQDETAELLDTETPYVVRFKMPEDEAVEFEDLIRGKMSVETDTLDDKVLFKSDGLPTYHLANIVDDHLMEISHVIRGEEWLPSLPLHIMLYKSFKWEAPQFAHLPLLLKPEGSGKLSKRDGDRLGFPVFPIEWTDPKTGETSMGYREEGYFSGAFVNMLALLGWNPGTEQEIFSMDQLIQAFSLDRVGKSGSRFDPTKAAWFNHQYLIAKSNKELAELYSKELEKKGILCVPDKLERIVGMIKERSNFVKDFWGQSSFFFEAPKEYDAKAVKKRWKENSPSLMIELSALLENMPEFTAHAIHDLIESYCNANELGMGQIMIPLRICVVGGTFGPDLTQICEIIERGEVLSRIQTALDTIKK